MKKLHIPIIASMLSFSLIVLSNPLLAEPDNTQIPKDKKIRDDIASTLTQIREINPKDVDTLRSLAYFQRDTLAPLGWHSIKSTPLRASYTGQPMAFYVFAARCANVPDEFMRTLKISGERETPFSEAEKKNIREAIGHPSQGNFESSHDGLSFTLSNITKANLYAISGISVGHPISVISLESAPPFSPTSRVYLDGIGAKENIGLSDIAQEISNSKK